MTIPVPAGFQGFAYVLDGEAAFGANRRPARPAQLVLLGPGTELSVTDATPGARFLLMTGQPYGSSRCSTARTWTSPPVRPDRRSQDGTHRTGTRRQGVGSATGS